MKTIEKQNKKRSFNYCFQKRLTTLVTGKTWFRNYTKHIFQLVLRTLSRDQDVSLDQSGPSGLLRHRISESNNSFNNQITLLSILNLNSPGPIVKELNYRSVLADNLDSPII